MVMDTVAAGTVEISFSPLPAHVRTARLVAAAVARRCGVDELLLDEIRLAVGEACSRAVGLHARSAPKTPIMVSFSDSPGRFQVAVKDGWPGPLVATDDHQLGAPVRAPVEAAPMEAVSPEHPGDDMPLAAAAELGLAVLSGLVDDLEIESLEHGAVVRMSWPARGRLRQR